MVAVLSIDIDSTIELLEKNDGDSVSAGELGVNLLTNAIAGTLPNGQRCIETNGLSNLLLRPEALATATARTEDHYAVRFHLRAKTSGAVTPGNFDSFIRNAAAGDPRFHLSYNATHFNIPGRHASPGELHQFVSAQTSTAGQSVPFNESVELTWIAHRSGTAASDFVGMFLNGVCVAAGTNLQNVVTFSNANFFQLPIVANITWQIHGTLEVYSVDDYVAEGLLEPFDETYQIYQALGSNSGFRLPGVSFEQSGITYADIRQNAGSGINAGDHTIELTGTTGSSETATYRPITAPTFSEDGHLHFRLSQVQSAPSATMTLRLQDSAGDNVLRVRITESALDGPSIDYNIGGGWVTIEDSGVAIDNLHVFHVTQRSDGWFSIMVKDDTIVNTADGAVWSTKVYVGHTSPIRQVQVNRSGTYLSSTSTYRGHLEISHRPMIEVYTDSWTSGDSTGDGTGKAVNQGPNHISLAMRGAKVGERFSRESFGILVGSGANAFRFDGAGAFGRRGWSESDWVATSPNLPDHVIGANCLIGCSCMNTMDENESTINAGGAGVVALLAAKTAIYVDAITRLLAGKNNVWFCGFITPPVGSFTDRTTTAEKAQFVSDLNASVLAALADVFVPSGSALAVSDVQTYAEDDQMEDPATDWAWDEYGIHLSGGYDDVYLEYAIACAQVRGFQTPGGSSGRLRRLWRSRLRNLKG